MQSPRSPRSPSGRRESYAEPEHPPEFGDDYDSGEEEEGGAGSGGASGGGGGSEGTGVFEMGNETEVPPDRRQSVQEEVRRRLSKDGGSKGSESTDKDGFKSVSF